MVTEKKIAVSSSELDATHSELKKGLQMNSLWGKSNNAEEKKRNVPEGQR